MRTRESYTPLGSDPGMSIYEQKSSATAPWVVSVSSPQLAIQYETKRVEDMITPGYTQRLKRGDTLPINPFKVVRTRREEELGFQLWLQRYTSVPYWQQRWSGAYPPIPDGLIRATVPAPDESILADCINNAIASVKSGILDAATSTMEAREVYSLFKDTVLKLLKLRRGFLKDFKRYWARLSNKQRAVGVSKAMADYWLQYRYGWLPLVLTLQSALEAYNADLEKGMAITGRSRVVTTLNDKVEINDGPDVNGRSRALVSFLQGERTYRGFAYAKLDNVALRRYQIDPVVTAWELVPFSFIVDWFVDVGSFLQASSAYSPTIEIVSGGSIKDVYSIVSEGEILRSTTGAVTRQGSEVYGRTSTYVQSYERFPVTSQLPGLNTRLNWQRITDAVALARQLLKLR